MNNPSPKKAGRTGSLALPQQASAAVSAWRVPGFVLFAVILLGAFALPLYRLMSYAARSSLYSHIILIPLISLYLIWSRREQLPSAFKSSPRLAAVLFSMGAIALGLSWWMAPLGRPYSLADSFSGGIESLSGTIFGFVCLLIAGGFAFFGRAAMRAMAFPAALLFFMVPFPAFLKEWIEVFFQHTSADVAHAMIFLSGTPFLRDGLYFQLPGITLEVAEECSGIRSSLVLFIVSLLAGHLFLTSPWKRTVLTLAVIPLAIVRNGFRIFTIAMLCVHVDPGMINSVLHRRGGPLFFALFLIPFFLFLIYLWRLESRRKSRMTAHSGD
jgi:exosortase C (VPDSG-CTERM-specific)